MKILGIESSCDETAASVVENGTNTIAQKISSSMEMHSITGGIIPEMAAREQLKCIIPVIESALTEYNKKTGNNKINTNRDYFKNIDALAVTVGPGLIGSLLVGVETAKTLSYTLNKPIVPVNHIFAHIYANWLEGRIPKFPAIALVVSGGHTELFLMENHGELKWLGGTLDDAAGEAFDKGARLLGLGFPGGPEIAKRALKFSVGMKKKYKLRLPRPMIGSKDLNFSFSGLKTAIFREVNLNKKNINDEFINFLSFEIEDAITDVLVRKTINACLIHNIKSLLLGGGVAANKKLSEKFRSEIIKRKLDINYFVPHPSLCTDNASYIASFAYFNYKPMPFSEIQAYPNLFIEV